MRRFEVKAGRSSKFWELEVRGTEVVVRFGRIGAAGQTRRKRAASARLAAQAAKQLVREKLGKGYVELRTAKAAARAAAPAPAKQAAAAAAKPRAAATRKPGSAADEAIQKLWMRIERWFAKHRPELSLGLRPGATDKQIAAAEKALGQRFPDDFRASLRVHDGQDDHCQIVWLPVALQLGSLASFVRCWKGDRGSYVDDADDLARLDKGRRVRQVHFHPRQIPFAGTPHWDYGRLLFDFVPGPDGTAGQVIARSDIDLMFVAASFRELLTRTARGLEDGSVVVEVLD